MIDSLFINDKRGVSAIIGAILLFGILVIALASYQATIVPQENAQAEFQHMEQIENDLLTLQSGMLTAGQANTPHFQTIELGTTYPNRIFTINPPPSSGTLETSEEYEITITDENDVERTIPTRFIQYTPRYFEMESSPTWIDNSVVYLDERYLDSRQGGKAVKEEQSLIRNSEKLRITAVQNDFRKQDVQAVTIQVHPTEDAENTLENLEGELEVALPTRLNNSEYWETMEGETEDVENIIYEGVNEEVDETSDGLIHEVEFTVNSPNDLLLNTVGIDAVPTDDPSQSRAFTESVSGPINDNDDDSSDSQFSTLSAEVTSSGPGNIEDVTFTAALSEGQEDVTFVIEDNANRIDTGSETITTEEEEITRSVDPGTGSNRPVTLTVDVDGGECKETDFDDQDSSISDISEWDNC